MTTVLCLVVPCRPRSYSAGEELTRHTQHTNHVRTSRCSDAIFHAAFPESPYRVNQLTSTCYSKCFHGNHVACAFQLLFFLCPIFQFIAYSEYSVYACYHAGSSVAGLPINLSVTRYVCPLTLRAKPCGVYPPLQ